MNKSKSEIIIVACGNNVKEIKMVIANAKLLVGVPKVS
jgi:hypothetical protein